jgi:hypothetical protein
MNRSKYCFLIGIMAFLICLQLAAAQTIVGVSPGTVNFVKVLRGGYAERVITISASTEKLLNVSISKRGDIRDWISFPSVNLTVTKDRPGRLLVTVKPPSDIPNGEYTGFITVQSTDLAGSGYEEHATGVVIPILEVVVNVEIVDNEIFQCSASEFAISSAEKGDDLILKTRYANLGNIRIRPKISAAIWDQDQLNVVKNLDLTGDEILPTREEEVTFRIPTKDLEIGQYWLEVGAPDCYLSLTFVKLNSS